MARMIKDDESSLLPAFSSCSVLLAGLTGANPAAPLGLPLGPGLGAAPISPAVEGASGAPGCRSSKDLSRLS